MTGIDRLVVRLTATVVLISGSACAPAPSKQVQEVRMPADAPFEIRLEATKGPGLSARLVNRSEVAQPVLHDARLQPSRVVLSDAAGAELEAYDRRELMKFDPRVYCSLFRPLPAGGRLPLEEARFERDGSSWSFAWGPFSFEDLPAGTYSARVTWTSEAATCLDDADSEPRPVPGVWLGTVESNRVDIVLR